MSSLYMDVHQKISEDGVFITSLAAIRYNQAIQLIYNAIGFGVLPAHEEKYNKLVDIFNSITECKIKSFINQLQSK